MNERWVSVIRMGIEANQPLISIWQAIKKSDADLSYLEVQQEHTRLLREKGSKQI